MIRGAGDARTVSTGWPCPDLPAAGMDGEEPSAEEIGFLKGLMAVGGQEQIEFLR
jgi:hypothetical protein